MHHRIHLSKMSPIRLRARPRIHISKKFDSVNLVSKSQRNLAEHQCRFKRRRSGCQWGVKDLRRDSSENVAQFKFFNLFRHFVSLFNF